MAEEIPEDVRAYLLAGDGLGRVSVTERYPNVEARLRTPEVQATLYRYLAGKEPWAEEVPTLAMAALDTLLATPTAEGAKSIRKLIAHPNPLLRLRAYRYLFAVVYPRDPDGMARVVRDMLTDNDEPVRLDGAHFVRNLKMAGAMRAFLQDWIRRAPERKWDHGESYAIILELVK